MMNKLLRFGFIIIITTLPTAIYTQSLPEHISNTHLYSFLDELANDHVITLTTVAKPYTRSKIAAMLTEASTKRERLTARQQYMLDTYLNDYALELWDVTQSTLHLAKRDTSFLFSILPPTLTYRDSLFRFNLKPILGANYYSNSNGTLLHSWGGAAVNAYVGSNWAVWASLRDHRQDGARLTSPTFLTRDLGGNYKGLTGGGSGGEFSEMQGGIAWSWSWGYLSLEKDHLSWGDGYSGATILSGRTPSYAMLKLHMHPTSWLQFNYHHGWLISDVVDSTRTYTPTPGGPDKILFRDKYIAANLFTLTPIPRLDISLGNLVIYSDMNVYPGYLIPFMFYKSVVHTQAARAAHNQNAAMFFNVSSRLIPHLHLYGTWFVDEFSITRVGDPNRTNFTSTKVGGMLSNWPIRDVALTAEYTFSYPKTYQHRTPATTYQNNSYPLGYYLNDNARELYLALSVKPIAGLYLEASYRKAEKGNLYPYIYIQGQRMDEDPYMKDVVWLNETIALKANYVLYNNVSLLAEIHLMDIKGFDVDDYSAQQYLDMFTPGIFQGKTTTSIVGLRIGF